MPELTNWSGNYSYRAARLHVPESLEELQETIRGCRTAKALGTRHSFNGIADTNENQISLQNFTETTLDQGEIITRIDSQLYGLF